MNLPQTHADASPDLQSRLQRHVHRLAMEIGERNVWRPDALALAQSYIREQWEALGFAVSAQDYRLNDVMCANLEVSIAGAAPEAGIILVGAHYDSVAGSPGADDNASGVAGLLEIARLLGGAVPVRTLKLVAFVNEEWPFFYFGEMGSKVYARTARARGDDIRLMVSLEMLGCYGDTPGSQRYPPLLRYFYPPQGDFIAFVSNLASRSELRQMVAAFRAETDFPCQWLASPPIMPGISWSDHSSFWRAGYSALMVTDTAFYRYPYYHSALDTAEKLSYGDMARVVEGLARALMRLAGGTVRGPAGQKTGGR